MSENHLASIIISSYNYGCYLREAIDSALNQTYHNVEVIVVDDGSTDNSQEVIAGYGDRVVCILKETGGQASALNAGFEASRGEVIFFLDSDDMLLPPAVKNAVNLITENDVIKVHWPLWEIEKDGSKTGKIIPSNILPEGDLCEVILRNGPDSCPWPPTSGNAFSREFLKQIFPIPEPEYITCPDSYFCTLAPLFGHIGKILEPQGCWRKHGRNHSTRVPFDERLNIALQRCDQSYSVLKKFSSNMGFTVSTELWEKNPWIYRLKKATQDLLANIPPKETFILVDQDEWASGEVIAGRRKIPFLERDGNYWGLPPNSKTAIRELERLRQSGASFIVFTWPAFWWLDYYSKFHRYLRVSFNCVLKNESLVIFDLSTKKSHLTLEKIINYIKQQINL